MVRLALALGGNAPLPREQFHLALAPPLSLGSAFMSTTSHFVSSTAIPLLLTIPPLYFVYSLLFPSVALPTANSQLATSHHDSYNWAPTTGPKTLLLRDYTPKELAQFDGKGGDGRILLAIKGQVFDVSAGRNFYGPGASDPESQHIRAQRVEVLRLTLARSFLLHRRCLWQLCRSRCEPWNG